jgi:hypothetical protein
MALRACGNERGTTVQQALSATFRRYGLPEQMLMDTGSPWGSDAEQGFTPLTLWLIRLGVRSRTSARTIRRARARMSASIAPWTLK